MKTAAFEWDLKRTYPGWKFEIKDGWGLESLVHMQKDMRISLVAMSLNFDHGTEKYEELIHHAVVGELSMLLMQSVKFFDKKQAEELWVRLDQRMEALL